MAECHGIHDRIIEFHSKIFGIFLDESGIKCCIMCNNDIITTEFQKLRQDHVDGRCMHNHLICNGSQLLYTIRDRFFRIDKFRETIDLLSIFYLYSSDLYDLILLLTKTGRLDIEYDIFCIQSLSFGIDNQILQVIDKISLTAKDQFKAILHTLCMCCDRECLCNAVIRDCNRRVSPVICTFHDLLDINNTVHLAHNRMHM